MRLTSWVARTVAYLVPANRIALDWTTAPSQRIEAVDREIEVLVYELYGLSEGEREIVEGG